MPYWYFFFLFLSLSYPSGFTLGIKTKKLPRCWFYLKLAFQKTVTSFSFYTGSSALASRRKQGCLCCSCAIKPTYMALPSCTWKEESTRGLLLPQETFLAPEKQCSGCRLNSWKQRTSQVPHCVLWEGIQDPINVKLFPGSKRTGKTRYTRAGDGRADREPREERYVGVIIRSGCVRRRWRTENGHPPEAHAFLLCTEFFWPKPGGRAWEDARECGG